jgi:hypothetical protein
MTLPEDICNQSWYKFEAVRIARNLVVYGKHDKLVDNYGEGRYGG